MQVRHGCGPMNLWPRAPASTDTVWGMDQCAGCVDWGAVLTGLSTLTGVITGALLQWARMHSDYERGRSLRPPKPPRH